MPFNFCVYMSIGSRLKIVREELGYTISMMAKTIGMSHRGYQDNESGRTTPKSSVVTKLIELGFNSHWILTGEGEMRIADSGSANLNNDLDADKHILPSLKQMDDNFKAFKHSLSSLGKDCEFWATELAKVVHKKEFNQKNVQRFIALINNEKSYGTIEVDEFKEEYILIPSYHISVSAGHGSLNDETSVTHQLAFRRNWINHRGLNPSNLAIVFAKGDSMEPTIHNSNTLLVDLSDTSLSDGSIFVLRVGENLFAKRLQQHFDGTVELLSDNKEYKAKVVQPDELEQLAIIGKVVWIGKDLY